MIIILIMIKGAIKYLTYFLGFVSKVTKTSWHIFFWIFSNKNKNLPILTYIFF
jgi:hypothetical protein